jgi:hypothetical protein
VVEPEAIAGGVTRKQAFAGRAAEGSDRWWREAIAGDRRWREAIAGGGKRSHVEGRDSVIVIIESASLRWGVHILRKCGGKVLFHICHIFLYIFLHVFVHI